MADKEERKETDSRGADWEVVSLTASTYAAAPGPGMGDSKSGEKSDKDKSETSNALFMSGHFVFPPSQHENLPLEPENTEILDEQGGEDYVTESIKEKAEISFAKSGDNWNVEKLTESPFFDEKGNRLTVNDMGFGDSKTLSGLNLAGKEDNIYNSAKFHSFHGEPIMGESNIDDEDKVLAESIESSLSSNVPDEDNDGSGLPYSAWWKKQAAALYAHAKEANTFWSIFIAAAVMGLVIIGQQWQKESWQVLHHRWHSGVYDEFQRTHFNAITLSLSMSRPILQIELYTDHEKEIEEANKLLIKKIEDDQFLNLVVVETEVQLVCKEPYSIYKSVLKSRCSINAFNQIAQLRIIVKPKPCVGVAPLCNAQ